MQALHGRIRIALWLVTLLMLFSTAGAAAHSPPTATEIRDEMRRLWEEHITWTRLFIISAAEELPDREAATRRLLQNQDDIGDAIKPYYGEEAGEQLSALLRDHILIAAEVVDAARAGDSAEVDGALERWYGNADEIAAFLATANPQAWPLEHMQPMMRDHLDLTLQEATQRLSGDYEAEVATYDRVHVQILEMADMLSAGLISGLPAAAPPTLPTTGASSTAHEEDPSLSLLLIVAGATALALAIALTVVASSRGVARAALDTLRALPRAMQVGLLILAAGGVVDLLYHAAPLLWHTRLDHLLGEEGHRAHLIMIVGMAVTLLGVATRGSAVAGAVEARATSASTSMTPPPSRHS